jgi:hypothetical protein
MSNHTLSGSNIAIQSQDNYTILHNYIASQQLGLVHSTERESYAHRNIQICVCELFHHVSVLLFSTFPRRYSLTSADATCKREHRDDQITMRAFRVLSTGSGQKGSSIRSSILHLGWRRKALFHQYQGAKLKCYHKPLCSAITSSRSLFGTNNMDRCYLH